MRPPIILILTLVLALPLAGCLGGGGDVATQSADGSSPGDGSPASEDAGTGGAARDGTSNATTPPDRTVVHAKVEARDVIPNHGMGYSFRPDRIEVPRNATVTIELTSHPQNLWDHDLVIPDLAVESEVIGPGETTKVTFQATSVGEFRYICSIGDHASRGMEGTLVVLDPDEEPGDGTA